MLRGVKVGPSPDWLRQRLEALGQASINNVVDATNYVMLELGHPLHAFDLDLLNEHRIVVRRARAGEKMRTLDGIERTLTPEMCVIADASRAVAIAGVMGGAETEIRSDDAQYPARIRVVRSDFHSPHIESARPAHGSLDAFRARRRSGNGGAGFAPLRGVDSASGAAAKSSRARWTFIPGVRTLPAIELTRKEFLRVMGADVPDAEIEAILSALGFAPVRSDADARRRGFVDGSMDVPAPVVARRRHARNRLDRRSRAALRRRQISARGCPRQSCPRRAWNMPKPKIVCASG